MNGTRSSVADLVRSVSEGVGAGKTAEVVVCPPHIFLADVQAMIGNTPVKLGAQDVSEHESGAYTGEVSAAMLAEYSCQYAIVGHSERRTYHNESDAQVARKMVAAQQAGLMPIVCVGEQLDEREGGTTEAVIGRQLDALLEVENGLGALQHSVIAYEPVWAIGTGKTASPQQAQDVHAFIRQRIAATDARLAEGIQILYGGSVKADNAAELFGMSDIDGGLIGGASLKAADFLAICDAAH
jgi:triosephosphate isomerase